uniref:Uncharacterized protein n=1 Tax=Anguilla anguilla TaxID=7936 RepID=A0A0E9V8G7_ANGAN
MAKQSGGFWSEGEDAELEVEGVSQRDRNREGEEGGVVVQRRRYQ